MEYEYYYNIEPNQGVWRNNLVYTSLISKDKKTFVKWFYNDTDYHQGKNQVVDTKLMDEKWNRELHFLNNMAYYHPDLVPEILDINIPERKIYLRIDGVDLWQRSLDNDNCSFDKILPDWKDQMLNIVKTIKKLGWHKYSMHPNSWFIINGKLKSINYFFTYKKDEPFITLKDIESHISMGRREKMTEYLSKLGIIWDEPVKFTTLDQLCWNSFRSNYPHDFVDEVIECLK
jgi:hypothetical protein